MIPHFGVIDRADLERLLMIFLATGLALVTALVFVVLLLYQPEPKYEPPCRGPGHVELPREKCE